ncbi:MAG: tetrahydromethanopterin S-methyltransferase subunit D [Methanosphaera sp. SHI613]|jgi:tetrahydromethanopterin S-methyltransferase subunit D|nr:MAG: tetrahydromethanopterin S-methyltransferase subunit D [Methanosphaera sp. SHI613]
MLSTLILLIIAQTLIGVGVHFIPVGGAPAALSTTAGVPTGAPMITIGMGITGILVTSSVIGNPIPIVLLSGMSASMLMMAITMFFSNLVHVYGVGVTIASSAFKKDPLTSFKQEEYVSPGTTGHGIPTISFISGLIGSLLGGLGGSLLYVTIYTVLTSTVSYINQAGIISALLTLLVFFVVAVMSSYNIGGTIQGFFDKKFKSKIKSGFMASLLTSILVAVIYIIILGGLIYG